MGSDARLGPNSLLIKAPGSRLTARGSDLTRIPRSVVFMFPKTGLSGREEFEGQGGTDVRVWNHQPCCVPCQGREEVGAF